jgi:AraC family transcriptional regulator, melibiose operon regulatory protein
LDMGEGMAVLYWASQPRLLASPTEAICTMASIPLERFLRWKLPIGLRSRLLAGRPAFGIAGDWQGMSILRWEEDLESPDPFIARAAELEIQAAVFRMARQDAPFSLPRGEESDWRRAAAWLLSHLDQPVGVSEIAKAVGRHPSHLMRAFKRGTGMTIGSFVLMHRVARAKRLLIETDLSSSQVGLESGFGSERRFFEAFRESTGTSPGAYRRQRGSSSA